MVLHPHAITDKSLRLCWYEAGNEWEGCHPPGLLQNEIVECAGGEVPDSRRDRGPRFGVCAVVIHWKTTSFPPREKRTYGQTVILINSIPAPLRFVNNY